MNYTKHYNLLIERAKTRKLEEYVERHHIVPKCMGGNDSNDNLVELTPEEHYVAHQLLVKIYPEVDSLVYAANKMTVASKHTKRNNKRYGWLKRKYQSVCKKRIGDKNPSYGRSWYYCPETSEEGKFLPADVPDNWIKGRKTTIEDTICIMCGKSTNSKKAKWCASCREKANYGRKKTVIKQQKKKDTYTIEEKKQALVLHNGNIRRALFSLGLNDSGPHYKIMKEIKASIYPLATNQ